ncbi:lysophospholipase catalytic domain-containing protein [Lipomyces kononenkoae]|uniref:Lysophospholipase catalytic domain-containing protein n=1 Tax=Lipomyces kononenkoae TaxID=34357 RepID=A0ACC3T4Y2_LIPKO
MKVLFLSHLLCFSFPLFASLLASINSGMQMFSAHAFNPFVLNPENDGGSSVFWKRGSPQAPNNYTPSVVDCPSTKPSIRNASQLSQNETSWLYIRRNNTIGPLRDLLVRSNITGFDVNNYINNVSRNGSLLPNIGIAVSGGGYRALMNGAGAVAAFDNRTAHSTSKGELGGLLQASTYIAGLSGGSWLVGSLYANNLSTIQSILNTKPATSSLWQFENSVIKGPSTLSASQYWGGMARDVKDKEQAGYNTTITDYWGRGLSYQLVNTSDGGVAYTYSSIADDPFLKAGNAPLPIIIADERPPGQLLIPGNATIFEFNPWEMGTFDPTTFAFSPVRYVGSNFSGGSLAVNGSCVRGYDNIGFVMGTSSSLFNQAFLTLNASSGPSQPVANAISNILQNIGENNQDIAAWPNPFYHYANDTNQNAQTTLLTLVDGGEDLQNIPLHPLIQPLRHVDVIFAIDSSADTDTKWPNGTSLVATYQRSQNSALENGTGFPSIPDQNTFLNLGLNSRPTFFGCNASNLTSPSPLIVYIPNSPYSYLSNVSTFQLSYNNTERNAIVQNGYDVATMGNGTQDAQWPTCVGCAILARSFNHTGTAVPSACVQCFQKFCWDGTVNSSTPAPYEPTLAVKRSAAKPIEPSST